MGQNRRKSIQCEIFWLGLLILTTLTACEVVLHLWEIDLSILLYNQEDSIGVAALAQDYISNISRNSLSAMPFNGGSYLEINTAFIHKLLLKVICLFTSSFGFAGNILYLSGYFLVSFSMYTVLRKMKICNIIAYVSGILYAFLPYHKLRGIGHIYLGMYYMVPFICWIIYEIMDERRETLKSTDKEKKNFFWSAVIICVILALTDIYYVVFSCILLVAVGVLKFWENKKICYISFPLLLCGVMLLIIIITNIPYVLSLVSEKFQKISVSNRNLTDLEMHGLRISQLLLPIQDHRIDLLAQIRSFYDGSIADTESKTISLGCIMSCGFLLSVFYSLVCNIKTRTEYQLRNLGVLNLICIIFATIGGFNIFIGMISPVIRCYNRMSVFIAAFSIMAVGLSLQALYEKIVKKKSKFVFMLALVGLMIAGILDQNSMFDKEKYQENIQRDNNRQNMIEQIEKLVQEDSMIFMMPVITRNEEIQIYNLHPYEQQWPALYSDTLRWSASTSLGVKDQNRQWKTALSFMDIYEMLQNISVTGFRGIWLDEDGYDSEEFTRVKQQLDRYLGEALLVSDSGKQYFYSLEKFNNDMEGIYSSEEREELKMKSFALGNRDGDYYYAHNLLFQGDAVYDTSDSLILKENSIQCGPYISLEQGEYVLSLAGNGLSEQDFSVTYDYGAGQIYFETIYNSGKEMEVRFLLEEDVDDAEFVLRNGTNRDVIIRYYYIEKLEDCK